MINVLELKDLPLDGRTCVTVGGFDGIHLGHAVLLEEIKREAKVHKAKSLVITFKVPPKIVLGRNNYGLLMTIDEKIKALDERAVDFVLLLDFREVKDLPPDEFIERIVMNGVKACRIVLGFNHRFGQGGKGDAAYLAKNLDRWDFALTVIPPIVIEGEIVSSTRIRQLVAQGEVKRASLLLGHPYKLSGTVVKGHGIGRKIGFPTANIEVEPNKVRPAVGVYAVIARIDGKEYKAVLNIGYRPTVSQETKSPQVEIHIPDFEGGELYGKRITVEFYERLRAEHRFPSLVELKQQIQRDIEKAMEILNGQKKNRSYPPTDWFLSSFRLDKK